MKSLRGALGGLLVFAVCSLAIWGMVSQYKPGTQQNKQDWLAPAADESTLWENAEKAKLMEENQTEILEYLETEIDETMQLPELVDAFERMCRIPLKAVAAEDDMILFETGTYSFSGSPMFHFSLVRQFPNRVDDEFYQLHLTIQYEPSERYRRYLGHVWDEEIDGDIFDYVRNSEVYQVLKEEKIAKIELYLDET